jgi:hypothetical protein
MPPCSSHTSHGPALRTWKVKWAAIALAASAFTVHHRHDGAVLAQTGPLTFKIAFWNMRGGSGQSQLPGRSCSFTMNSNCTDVSQPLNAWGMHVVQDALIRSVRNDAAIVALGVVEAWGCAMPQAIRQVLAWKSTSTVRNGIALIARFGFGGPEEWVQLDTSKTLVPADTKFVLRVPVCLDQSCTRSVMTYATHLNGAATLEVDEYATYVTQARQTLDFTSRASGTAPHIVIGDLNVWEGTSIICSQKPKNEPVRMFRSAGYLDAWPATRGVADGSTGMWNRQSCGVPEGNLWKRIDYSWSKRMTPLSVTRFGMVQPGECAPSDHAGIIAKYALENTSVPAPVVSISAPAQNATVQGVVPISATATASGGVIRLEWLLDGRVIAVENSGPYTFNWDTRRGPNGVHVLRAAATNAAGRRTVSAARSVTVRNPIGPDDEIVLYGSDAAIKGTGWRFVADASAASGRRLQSANAGATVTSALSSPASYAELTFDANADTPYRLWIRGRAIANSPDNDSVHVQFSGSVNQSGTAAFRSGTHSSTRVNIEDCVGCGLSSWGWQDNEVGKEVLGPLIYFAAPGPQRLRIQAREDGLGIDQIVLSAVRYRFGAPGALRADTTILPTTGTAANLPPTIQLTVPAAGTALTAPATVTMAAATGDLDDGVARVDFLVNGTAIGQDTSAPF